MSLNDVVSAERVHIGFFGLRNAGKSSLVNAVTGQNLAVVSDVRGTTTDPVQKAMELLPLGPVVIIDTPGLDDEGDLGQLRVQRAEQTLNKTDIAVLVVDATVGLTEPDRALQERLSARKLPFLIAFNKADLLPQRSADGLPADAIYVSAVTGEGVHALKERLAALAKGQTKEKRLLADLLSPGDHVILVTPIDESAPKGRLILPQQQTLREVLDVHCTCSVCQDTELTELLTLLKTPPRLVITDSQAFERVAKLVPESVPLTSFSLLFARYKGDLPALIAGAEALRTLKDGDRVLISEGCTHHRQCNDIGTVKLPGWIRQYTGANPEFCFTSGGEFPEDLTGIRLIVHCGGCMLSDKQMQYRQQRAKEAGVPMVNYGAAIAQMHGVLSRSLAPLMKSL